MNLKERIENVENLHVLFINGMEYDDNAERGIFLKNMKNYPPGNTGSCGFNHSLRLFQRLDVEISDHVAGV